MDEAALTTGMFAQPLLGADRIADRVADLAGQIARAYADQELTILAVLEGAGPFVRDLVGRLPIPARVLKVRAKSYRGTATRAGTLQVAPLPEKLFDRHVLVVDDILDSGATLSAICRQVQQDGPASCRACVLLRKPAHVRRAQVAVDFVGFDIPDAFVIGYGLDYDGQFRSLPDIRVLQPGHGQG